MGCRASCSEDDDAIVMLRSSMLACEAWQKPTAKPDTSIAQRFLATRQFKPDLAEWAGG
jgi:hypothetical protein